MMLTKHRDNFTFT